MNDEIPYRPQGMDEYLQSKTESNARWLRKRGLLPDASQTESAQADSVQRDGSASGCTLQDPDMMQCCCNCAHLRAVHYHCCTTPKPDGVTGCVCGVQKGWACHNPEMDGRIYDNWPQHSCGCELYTARTPNAEVSHDAPPQ